MTQEKIPVNWKVQKNPPGLTRSFQFDTYNDTSKFLEELAELSEKMSFYPNINFTQTQVNVNIDVTGHNEDIDENQVKYDFANKADTLIASSTH